MMLLFEANSTMKRISLTLLGILLFPLASPAHGPTPQKAKESIIINASVDTVWNAVKQFDSISAWHPNVKASQDDGMHGPGGVRTMT